MPQDTNETHFDSTSNNSSTGVEFEEDTSYVASRSSQKPTLIQWVVRHSGGMIKNEQQANNVLVLFVIGTLLVSLYLFLTSDDPAEFDPADYPTGIVPADET